jgi:sigma-E factor negative regulatory protein RseA
MMPERSTFDDDKRQRLSLLLDGEADAGCAQALCRAWRDDGELRATWHAYHLIGDVLRSDDLAHPVERDETLLGALRQRLAAEPVVLAPAPAAPEGNRERRTSRVAVAAAFAMLAGGALLFARLGEPDRGPPSLAVAPQAAVQTAAAPASAQERPDVQAVAADGKLIRDARLDRYLAAHKEYADSSAIVVPGLVLRSSATVAPAR